MLQNITFVLLISSTISMADDYIHKNHPKPWKVRFYPKKTVFSKKELIDNGCVIFIQKCPSAYKQNVICARHYDGKYRTFSNYCEMEYENCNSWRQWSMIKRDRC